QPLYTVGRTFILADGVTGALSQLAVVGTLWAGSLLVLGNDLTPGQLMSFYALVGYLTAPAAQLVTANRTVQDALIASDRLFEILDLETDDRGGKPAVELGPGSSYDVELCQVTFGYSVGRPVLHGFSLKLLAGEVTALVGES